MKQFKGKQVKIPMLSSSQRRFIVKLTICSLLFLISTKLTTTTVQQYHTTKWKDQDKVRVSNSHLPSVNQTWAHSVCSKAMLQEVLYDTHSSSQEIVTAIETDVMMGTWLDDDEDDSRSIEEEHVNVAITAHPPNNSSDLSVELFLKTIFECDQRKPHIKLDFKDIDAVKPTLHSLARFNSLKYSAAGERHVFLNVDILLGPGARQYLSSINPDSDEGKKLSNSIINSDDFFAAISEVFDANSVSHFSFSLSLGWRTSYRATGNGYEDIDVQNMLNIVKKHSGISNTIGKVSRDAIFQS